MNATPSQRLNNALLEVDRDRSRARSLPDDLPEGQTPLYDSVSSQREALPGYEAAPEYDRELHEAPLHTYYLRAPNKKSLIAVPYGPSTADSYKITSRSTRPFSKKPEMEVWRTMRARADDECISGIWFDTDGPLPWCPRARFIRHDVVHGDQLYKMEARNFSDWTISVDGTLYMWVLEARPFNLVLRANGSRDTVARFNFSIHGIAATGGAEAGNLAIYRDRLSQDKVGIEIILCSLVTTILQFKRMGRYYKNEPGAMPERAASLPEERLPLHRTAIAPFWSHEQG